MPGSNLIDKLLATPKFGDGIGLHRMVWILDQIQREFPKFGPQFIKVTGSNGKGGTSTMISAILRNLGLKEGLYTSPHLIQFNERIVIGGVPISDAHLEVGVAWVQAAVKRFEHEVGGGAFGGFEKITALAYRHMAAENVGVGCFEVGIGGRFDPVRTIPGQICALTSLDLEHTHLLGESLELIGYDKLELCPPGGTMVLYPLEDTALLYRLKNYAELCGIQLYPTADHCRVKDLVMAADGSRFSVQIDEIAIEDIHLPLLGEHQVQNAVVAVAAVKCYLNQNLPQITAHQFGVAVRQGLAEVIWPGRASYLPGPPAIYYDVGHTPQAIANYLATIRPWIQDKKVLLLTGASQNKSVEAMVAELAQIADQVVCTRAYHMGAEVDRIKEAVKLARPDLPLTCSQTIEEAVKCALKLATEEAMTIVIGGGLFLAVEAVHALQGHDPKQLRFF